MAALGRSSSSVSFWSTWLTFVHFAVAVPPSPGSGMRHFHPESIVFTLPPPLPSLGLSCLSLSASFSPSVCGPSLFLCLSLFLFLSALSP